MDLHLLEGGAELAARRHPNLPRDVRRESEH